MKIDIKENIRDAYLKFDSLQKVQIHRAARRAINRTIVSVRKESVGILKNEIRLKPTEIRKHIYLVKPRQKRLADMEGAVVFQSRGFELMKFVRGSKNITPQKGIKVARRRKVKVEITPGKKITLKKAFIAKTKRGNQVLQQSTRVKGHKLMQTALSLSGLMLSQKRKSQAEIIALASRRFQTVFQQELSARIKGFV